MSWDLLGHQWAVGMLREHVARHNLRHAYLITGPQGVGRRTLALRLSQAVNCLQPPTPGEPCGACRACALIWRMAHPDLAVVQAAQLGGTIKVDQIRELQRSLSLAPYEAQYRVAVLLRFEEAHISAQNAFLKTLEEPPPRVILLVTAESPERLLPTVVSRCEVIRLRPLPVDEVCQGLQERWGLPQDHALLLAHLSGGRPGYALGLHQYPEMLDARHLRLEDHLRLLASSRAQRFKYTEKLAKDKEGLLDTLQTWASLWRDVLMCAAGSAAPLVNLDRAEDITRLAGRFGLRKANEVLLAIQHTSELLEHNVNPRLATETLMLDLPFL
jgi:DNA polymerase III subunit delta'